MNPRAGRPHRQGRAGRRHCASPSSPSLASASTGKGVKIVGDDPGGPAALRAAARSTPALWLQLLPAGRADQPGRLRRIRLGRADAGRASGASASMPNQELVGLGASNIAAAFSGGYPVTGGFARSVVNFDAGAETPLAGAYHRRRHPRRDALPDAAVLASCRRRCWPRRSSWPCCRWSTSGAIRRTWTYSKADFAAMAATILLVLLVGVEAGIVAGVALSLLLFLWRTSRPHMAIVGQVPGTEHFRNVRPPPGRSRTRRSCRSASTRACTSPMPAIWRMRSTTGSRRSPRCGTSS